MQAPRRSSDSPPTIFHVTHWKAGSQWIRAILRRAARESIVTPREDMGQFLSEPIQEGMIYPTLYVTAQQFQQVALPQSWRRFVVIRDPRDTVVSAYFSLKLSHPPMESEPLNRLRERLRTTGKEDGLLAVVEEWMPLCAEIQRSWLESGEPLIRYEDLLDRDVEILEPTLIDRCGLPVPRARLRRLIQGARFEELSGGRRRGEEDVMAHVRKGVSGDWRNHFTEPVKESFKEHWGDLVTAAGYEADSSW